MRCTITVLCCHRPTCTQNLFGAFATAIWVNIGLVLVSEEAQISQLPSNDLSAWRGPPGDESFGRGPKVYSAVDVFGKSAATAAHRDLEKFLKQLVVGRGPAAHSRGSTNISVRLGKHVLFTQNSNTRFPLCDVFGAAAKCDRAHLARDSLTLLHFWRRAAAGKHVYASVKLPEHSVQFDHGRTNFTAAEHLARTLRRASFFLEDAALRDFTPRARQVFLSASGTTQWWHHDTSPGLFAQLYGFRRWDLLPPRAHRHLQLFPGPHPLQRRASWDQHDASGLRGNTLTVLLRPGQVICVPPFWFHAVTSVGGPSVGLQQFYDTHATQQIREVLSSVYLRPAWLQRATQSSEVAAQFATFWHGVARNIGRRMLSICATRWRHLPLAQGTPCQARDATYEHRRGRSYGDSSVEEWALEELIPALERSEDRAVQEMLFCAVHEDLIVSLVASAGNAQTFRTTLPGYFLC